MLKAKLTKRKTKNVPNFPATVNCQLAQIPYLVAVAVIIFRQSHDVDKLVLKIQIHFVLNL
ncbi:hypothetical protein BH23THE1_BH23THE1_21960 [soil metagenome]